MDKIKFYADLFGGTLSRILEFGQLDVINERLQQALDFLDKIIEHKFQYKVQDEEKDIVNWLNSKVLDDLVKDFSFANMCAKGHLEIVKLMMPDTDIHAYTDIAFRFACKYGHLDIAQLLFANNADVNAASDLAFRYTCGNGHISVAKWLYNLGVNIHAINDEAFKFACANGHKDVAEWLVEVGIDPINPVALVLTCEAGRLDILQWLHLMGNDVSENRAKLLYYVIHNRNRDILLWMNSIKKIFIDETYEAYKFINITLSSNLKYIESCDKWIIDVLPDILSNADIFPDGLPDGLWTYIH